MTKNTDYKRIWVKHTVPDNLVNALLRRGYYGGLDLESLMMWHGFDDCKITRLDEEKGKPSFRAHVPFKKLHNYEIFRGDTPSECLARAIIKALG